MNITATKLQTEAAFPTMGGVGRNEKSDTKTLIGSRAQDPAAELFEQKEE